jgi:hypothetical protein
MYFSCTLRKVVFVNVLSCMEELQDCLAAEITNQLVIHMPSNHHSTTFHHTVDNAGIVWVDFKNHLLKL